MLLLTEEQVAEVQRVAPDQLALDSYADPAMGNAYLTTSVYTDTPSFDVFYRTEGYNRDKFRVRRYGLDGPVFVERKTKNGDKVRKHRARINPAEVARPLRAPASMASGPVSGSTANCSRSACGRSAASPTSGLRTSAPPTAARCASPSTATFAACWRASGSSKPWKRGSPALAGSRGVRVQVPHDDAGAFQGHRRRYESDPDAGFQIPDVRAVHRPRRPRVAVRAAEAQTERSVDA